MKAIRKDPVIDEIREIRQRISERFGHDADKLVAYYMELQEKLPNPLAAATTRGKARPKRSKSARKSKTPG